MRKSMKQTVSCSVKMKMMKASAEVLMQTCGIYRAAAAYIIGFLPPHWDAVKAEDCASEKRSLLRL